MLSSPSLLSRFIVIVVGVTFLWAITEAEEEFNSAASSTSSVTTTAIQELCWSNVGSDSVCNVAVVATRTAVNLSFPLNLNCATPTQSATDGGVVGDARMQRFHNIELISLNGCHVTANTTLGVEYVPDPSSVQRLTIEMFRLDQIAVNTFSNCLKLERLELRSNAIDSIANDSLSGLTQLIELRLISNRLHQIETNALAALPKLQILRLHDEQDLRIESQLFIPNTTTEMEIISAKSFDWPAAFPDSLQKLYISKTPSVSWSESIVLNQLRTLSLISCQLESIGMLSSGQLVELTLSGNRLRTLPAHELPSLLVYDVSDNELVTVENRMLNTMRLLRRFDASENRIETVANDAFVQCYDLESVNLSGNRLRLMYLNLPAQQQYLKIVINTNPWSCKWVMDLVLTQPQLFANFEFQKQPFAVNIRGLGCRFYEGDELRNYKQLSTPSAPASADGVATPAVGVHTTSSSSKRNPRDTAILTLIILVAGVAVLFVLLFLHIKCRRDGCRSATEPFYRALPFNSGAGQQPMRMADRTDFVRHLPATDYEAPISCKVVETVLNGVEKNGGGNDEYRHQDEEMYEEIPGDRDGGERRRRIGSIERQVDEHFLKLNSLYGTDAAIINRQ